MPLKLNVGLSKKIGLPDYGSLGASCHVESELDSALLERDPLAWHEKANTLFAACREAVERQLVKQRSDPSQRGATASREKSAVDFRPVTAAQLRALRSLAVRQDFDVTAELQNRFGLENLESLSLSDASALIDAWKRQRVQSAGDGGEQRRCA